MERVFLGVLEMVKEWDEIFQVVALIVFYLLWKGGTAQYAKIKEKKNVENGILPSTKHAVEDLKDELIPKLDDLKDKQKEMSDRLLVIDTRIQDRRR